jgi:RNA polymerase sigma-70 factor (ECF subfamily)
MAIEPAGDDSLQTKPGLLSRVRKGDEAGWWEFYELYQDFIFAAARGAGLSPEESQDVVQETMLSVQGYISHFVPDQSRGRFRTWLRKIVQSRIADQYRRKRRNPLERAVEPPPDVDGTGTSPTHRLPDLTEVELARVIDSKLEQAILAKARQASKALVRLEHYQAYDLFAVQQQSAAEAAGALGISPITVRVQAFRVRRVVNREVRRIVRALDSVKRPGGTTSDGTHTL